MKSILIRNIKWLGCLHLRDKAKLAGAEMATMPAIDNAYLLIEDGLIKAFGKSEDAPQRANEVIDADGRLVLPAWCDSHTHLVFATYREGEFVDKIHGLTYEQIAAKGGGILNSAKKLQSATEDGLFETALQRLEQLQELGTGAIEIKSGYGLSYEGEMKMLRVIRRLKEQSKVTIKATFLGAHAFPAEFKDNHDAYLDLLLNRLLPEIADEGLADFIDAFCEKGYFSAEETDRILEAGAKRGLQAKVHVNQFNVIGGVQTSVKHNALSVDHLELLSDEDIAALKSSDTMPTALPACSFFLRIPYTPARTIIDAGLPLAIASDFNPGTSPSGNMNFVISLACIQMRMTPEEALNAATLNSAYAMGVSQQMGSIAVGKKANLIITKPVSSLAFLPYSFGNNCVERVIIS